MKNSLHMQLTECFQGAIKRAVDVDEPAVVTQSTNEKFGQYQCNSALKLAKVLKKSPRDVASAIIDSFEDPDKLVDKLAVAGPGFINVHLNFGALSERLSEARQDKRLGVPLPKNKQKILVDFSSPNIAKQMHVGHLRSTIIGDSIARVFEFLGHDVMRINHVGDWGTQFGMLIAFLKVFHPDIVESSEGATLDELVVWYKEAKKKFDESPTFKAQARSEVVKLQNGDPVSTKAWKNLCEISRRGFHKIYDMLGVKIEERGESFYNPILPEVIADAEEKGLAKEDDGALCIFLEGYKIPIIIQKTDRGFNYSTTDLAGFKYRVAEDGVDAIFIVTDSGQITHFRMVYEAAQKLGYIDPAKVRFDHVPFGVVLSPDGTKFKTRSGETEKLSDLLDEAVKKARAILEERNIDDLDENARRLGMAAVKYADLSCHRIKDYTFSYERMLKMEGNTAPFILYAYVRVQSIKRKVGKNIDELPPEIELVHPSEVALGLHILQFSEALDAMVEELLPNRITEYLFHLAEKFHAFFRDCRVEGSEEEASRLQLCEVTARTIKQGLDLLGIETLEAM